MKPLKKQHNVEKAKLLFELFPEDIPEFLPFIQKMTDKVKADADQLRKNWDMPLFDVEFWIALADKISIIIDQYKGRLSKSSRLFSDQLFDGYLGLFSVHCLQQYAKDTAVKASKFGTAVNLFFYP